MTDRRNSTDGLRAVLVLFATLGTISLNIMAAIGRVNGVTTAAISGKYPTILTPAGYAFSIWTLIYLGLLVFSVYQILPGKLAKFRSIRTIYILSCLFNCAWIYFWHREAIGICLALITALAATLIVVLIKFGRNVSAREALFTTVPFGIYAGWVTVAAFVNLAVFLVSVDIQLTPQTWNILGSVALVTAVAAALAVRVRLRNFFFPLSVGWGATAIAIGHGGNTALILVAALSVIVCLVLTLSFVMDLPSSSTTYE